MVVLVLSVVLGAGSWSAAAGASSYDVVSAACGADDPLDRTADEQQDGASTWKVTKAYTYGPDQRPVMLTATPINGEASVRLYSTNPRGDVEALTDPAGGAATATYRYHAYGSPDSEGTLGEDKETAEPGSIAEPVNPYRYNSKRADTAMGGIDMGFRNYDPGINQFTSRDSYNGALADLQLGTDPWNTNRYAFTGGNPITRVEMDGHLAAAVEGSGGCRGNCSELSRDYSKVPKNDVPVDSAESRFLGAVMETTVANVADAATLAFDVVAFPFSDDSKERWQERGSDLKQTVQHPIQTAQAVLDSCQDAGKAACSGAATVEIATAFLGFGLFKAASSGGALKDVAESRVAANTGARMADGLIGVPQAPMSRALARLQGLRLGDKSIVQGVDAFGSRAGSTFRGRGPTAGSDLDLLVRIDPTALGGRSGPWIQRTLRSIADDFEAEAEFPLSIHAPGNIGMFEKSIPGATFVPLG